MNEWRGYRGENPHQKFPPNPSRSQNRRRPPSGSWQPTVPSWEKKFCFSTCSISWRQLCEAKKMMPYYKNIAQWNDSAGEEAFHNAKARFWAEINGFPCDISLPNPDIYIDEIDWNCDIDPKLLLDLDQEPPAPSDGDKEGNIGFLGDSFNLSNGPIPCTGWGDAEDPVSPVNNSSVEPAWGNCEQNADCSDVRDYNGWENRPLDSWENGGGKWRGDCDKNADFNYEQNRSGWENKAVEDDSWENGGAKGWGNCDRNADNSNKQNWSGWESKAEENNSWENSGGKSKQNWSGWESKAEENNLWENGGGKSWGWGRWESDINKQDNWESRKNDWTWETNNGNCRKREGGGHYASGYKTSRFQGDDYQSNSGWRNCRGRKRVNFIYERPVMDNRPLDSWKWDSMHSCGPINHHLPAESGGSWCWEKPVS
ncbi:uncharacterized protein LOC143882106 [Tasmannia lanceolata]|uniref:uncharacterized protein LOC143882106 n=1 Tax=Tasmannia lanceolata TaxID=3420 RepID=UPI004062D812